MGYLRGRPLFLFNGGCGGGCLSPAPVTVAALETGAAFAAIAADGGQVIASAVVSADPAAATCAATGGVQAGTEVTRGASAETVGIGCEFATIGEEDMVHEAPSAAATGDVQAGVEGNRGASAETVNTGSAFVTVGQDGVADKAPAAATAMAAAAADGRERLVGPAASTGVFPSSAVAAA